MISPIGPERALLWRRGSRAIWAGDAVADFGHDWLPSRTQQLETVSGQPSIVPGIARGAEHGARQCTGETLYDVAKAARARGRSDMAPFFAALFVFFAERAAGAAKR